MSVKRIARIAILAALCIVIRPAFAFLPNVQPITAIFFVLSVQMGLIDSILVMGLTMTITAFQLGFGPWVFFQIITFAILLVIFRMLYPVLNHHRYDIVSIGFQALVCAILAFIYGVLIDSMWAVVYQLPWWVYVTAGIVFNLSHAVSTIICYPLITSLFRRVLR